MYDGQCSSYSELLTVTNEPTSHPQHNIKILSKEIRMLENDLSPPLIDDMLQIPKSTFH